MNDFKPGDVLFYRLSIDDIMIITSKHILGYNGIEIRPGRGWASEKASTMIGWNILGLTEDKKRTILKTLFLEKLW